MALKKAKKAAKKAKPVAKPAPRSAPVKVGETYTVVIKEVNAKGEGMARVNNFLVIVPETKKGDSVRIEITEVKPRYAVAEVIGKAVSEKEEEEFFGVEEKTEEELRAESEEKGYFGEGEEKEEEEEEW